MTVPAKIETTLRNLEDQAARAANKSNGIARGISSGGYDHRDPDCNGAKCFLEQYVVDHHPYEIAIQEDTYENKPYYTINWCLPFKDPIIIDLAKRIVEKGFVYPYKNPIEVVYKLNDNRDLSDNKFFELVRSLYH